MEPFTLLFLTSGLLLGWALGANDAANVFGTAVGTHMVRWITAATICSVFVIIGAVYSGAGTTETLGKLGAISTLAAAFMAALAAAIAVYAMTRAGLPVSTSQAIVGSIVGWNVFSGITTDVSILTKIVGAWVLCPVLAGLIAIPTYKYLTAVLRQKPIHLLRADAYTRLGLIVAGAFGAYSLGANNIANVVGVFVPAVQFGAIDIPGLMTISSAQQLLLLGGMAIALGVYSYSRPVMMTVGRELGRLSPLAAWVAVVSHSIVLFAFASQGLEAWLMARGLPTLPLVPVSSSQAVVGAVVGIAILQGTAGLRWSVLGKIILGWIATPILSGIICFVGLFFLQNVFGQTIS